MAATHADAGVAMAITTASENSPVPSRAAARAARHQALADTAVRRRRIAAVRRELRRRPHDGRGTSAEAHHELLAGGARTGCG
jgi:hypothetical protein